MGGNPRQAETMDTQQRTRRSRSLLRLRLLSPVAPRADHHSLFLGRCGLPPGPDVKQGDLAHVVTAVFSQRLSHTERLSGEEHFQSFHGHLENLTDKHVPHDGEWAARR